MLYTVTPHLRTPDLHPNSGQSYTESHSFSYCIYFLSLLMHLSYVPFLTNSYCLISLYCLISSYCIYLIFKLHRVSWLISYCLILFLIAWVCFYILMLFISSFLLAFFFFLHLFIEYIWFNYSSQTLLGIFLMFPDSLFPDVSHCCHRMWPYLSDVSRFCHWVWPYIIEVCEQMTNY